MYHRKSNKKKFKIIGCGNAHGDENELKGRANTLEQGKSHQPPFEKKGLQYQFFQENGGVLHQQP